MTCFTATYFRGIHPVRWGRRLYQGAVVMLFLHMAMPQPYAMPHRWTDLTKLSLEELMQIEIAVLTRRPQRWADTPAAVFVISQEDIRRSGVTTIPEALRLVPGIQVARVSSNRWAISSRGFNDAVSNKLQVLVDGRSVYNAIYAGVYWDVQDTLLDDVDRIEVIRGSGASLWGANAVNGVINIVTKSAAETQGALASVTTGTEEKFIGALRYGGALDDSAHFSAYIKHSDRDGSVNAADGQNNHDWRISKGAGRLDWDISAEDALSLMADYFNGGSDDDVSTPTSDPPYRQLVQSENRYSGYNLLGRWRHAFSATSESNLQLYYYHTEKDLWFYSENIDTFDIDFQHRFGLGQRREILWGLGYRVNDGLIKSSDRMRYDPEQRIDQLFSAFVQDDISLLPRKLSLILGGKFEKNDYTGFETQPNARLLWTPYIHHTFWTAVSRAVRTPTRHEHDVRVDQPVPGYPDTVYSIFGNPDMASEELTAYEAGYRFLPGDHFGIDLTLFYNHYDNLRTYEVGTLYWEQASGRYVLPIMAVNGMKGNAYGGELVLDWRPMRWWKFQGAYSYLEMDLNDPYSDGENAKIVEGESPAHQLSLRSAMNLPCNTELDLWFRCLDDLPAWTQDIPGYWTMDARIGWQTKVWAFDLVGQNLFDPSHPEFVSEFLGIAPSEIERSVYFKVTWRY